MEKLTWKCDESEICELKNANSRFCVDFTHSEICRQISKKEEIYLKKNQ